MRRWSLLRRTRSRGAHGYVLHELHVSQTGEAAGAAASAAPEPPIALRDTWWTWTIGDVR